MSWFSRLTGRPSPPAPSPTTLVVGLGNPGPDYAGTRHNAGFEVVDRLADRLGLALDAEVTDARRRASALVAQAPLPTEDSASDEPAGALGPGASGAGASGTPVLALAKPLTFMNRSGRAVAALLERYGLSTDDLLVVYDDLALEVGALRLRPKGSHGGHNGVRDIAEALGSTEFPRLRVGVGNSFPPGGQVDFVLSPFDDGELPAADAAFDEAALAALTFARHGLAAAMNRHNRR